MRCYTVFYELSKYRVFPTYNGISVHLTKRFIETNITYLTLQVLIKDLDIFFIRNIDSVHRVHREKTVLMKPTLQT